MTKAPTSRNANTFDSAHHSVHLPKPRHSLFLRSLIQFLTTTTQRQATPSWATQEGNAPIPTGDTNGTTAVGSRRRGTIPPPDVVKRCRIDGKQNPASGQGFIRCRSWFVEGKSYNEHHPFPSTTVVTDVGIAPFGTDSTTPTTNATERSSFCRFGLDNPTEVVKPPHRHLRNHDQHLLELNDTLAPRQPFRLRVYSSRPRP